MSEELNKDNIIDLSKQPIDESIDLFCNTLLAIGFDNVIVKVLGDRFLIVKGDSFGKSFNARKLNREDYKKFHKAISDFCIKNDIDIR